MRILIGAGGTGGHLFPAQTLADELSGEILFAGANLKSNPYFDSDRFDSVEITSGHRLPHHILRLCKGFWESWRLLGKFSPDLVVGFGSFYTLPLLLAAKLRRIPYVLYEHNALAGRVNRLFSSGAKFSATALDAPLKGKTVSVRPLLKKEGVSRQEAAAYFGLDPDRQTLLVFGGSQGAEAINRAVEGAAPGLSGWQLLHFTGGGEPTYPIPACVKRFEPKMECAWALADLAVTRAGATTVGEALQWGVPSIYIPFPRASEGHQGINARFVEGIGGGVLMEEESLTPESLLKTIDELDCEKSREAIALFQTEKRPTLVELIEKEFA